MKNEAIMIVQLPAPIKLIKIDFIFSKVENKTFKLKLEEVKNEN